MPQPRGGSVPAAFGWVLVLSIVSGIFLPALGIISGSSIAVVIVLNTLALLAGAIVGALAWRWDGYRCRVGAAAPLPRAAGRA
jgi:hypothetical protein